MPVIQIKAEDLKRTDRVYLGGGDCWITVDEVMDRIADDYVGIRLDPGTLWLTPTKEITVDRDPVLITKREMDAHFHQPASQEA